MATRDVVVRIRAEIGAFRKDMDAAAAKAKETAKKTEEAGKASESGLGRLAQTANAHEKAWNQVSTGMVASGVAVVGALSLSTKAAMDWESAWAGVTKTVDGTPAQMEEVETGLRKLARTLPSTHAEIAGVAEAAGQLGVARDDLLGFTKTMIDLGESTNLTAEDAATNIAQISNVMGTMNREGAEGVARFGSALVALGNDGASTEAEILSMAQRISGAGATIGATESDVLALSNTLASMGVKAELGGGVTTRVLLKMRTAMDEGGESLESFAKVAGVSADEFSAKFKDAPIEALDLVSKGIHRVNEAGGNVTATLKDMGIKGTEETQVMLALANSGDLLADSLELGARAWEENTALVDEATKRYETAESKVKIAWNGIKDAAISAGSVILPVVAGIAEGIATLTGWFSDLPGPAQTAITVVAGLAGVAALAGGAFMKFAPSVLDTIAGLRELRASTQRAHGPMTQLETRTRKLGSAAKTAAVGILALATVGPVIGSMVSSGDLANMDALNAALLTTGSLGSELNSVFTGKGNWFDGLDVSGIEEAFRIIGNPSVTDNVDQIASKILTFGNRGSSNMEFVTKNFEQMDSALSGMVKSGNIDAAASGYEYLAQQAEAAGVPTEKLAEIFPQYAAALKLANTEGKNTDMTQIIDGLDGVSTSAEDAKKNLDDFYETMVNTGMVVIGENEALRRLQESINSASKTITENGQVVKKNGEAIDATSEKYLASSAALDGIASSTLAVVEPMRAAGASTSEMADEIEHGRANFIKQAMAMGYSEKAAEAYADKLNLIPGAVYVQFDSNTDDIGEKIREIHELIKTSPDGTVTINENTPEVRQALKDLGLIVEELPDGSIKVTDDGTAEVTGKKIDKIAEKYREATINTTAKTGEAEKDLNWVARPRVSSITQQITKEITSIDNGPITSQFGGPRKQHGGKLPGKKDGGKLPYTGLGTDMILAVNNRTGLPEYRFDDGEWVIREQSATKYNGVLAAINADDPSVQHLAGYAGGGRPGGGDSPEFAGATSINFSLTVVASPNERRLANTLRNEVSSMFRKQGVFIG